jgi:hypothetical protein
VDFYTEFYRVFQQLYETSGALCSRLDMLAGTGGTYKKTLSPGEGWSDGKTFKGSRAVREYQSMRPMVLPTSTMGW